MNKTIGITGNTFRLPRGSKANSGNIVHANAAKSLFSNAVELNIDSSDEYIERVREQCSHLGFAAATMICLDSPPWIDVLIKVADFVDKLDLPVVAFGIGNSTEKKEISLCDAKVDPRSVRLLRALAEHAETVAVRGEFTADLCRKVGVTNVDVVGCQSLYYAASLNDPSAWKHREHTGRNVSSITGAVDRMRIIEFCIKNNVDLIGQHEAVEHKIALGQLSMQTFISETGAFKLPINTEIVSLKSYYEYISSHFYKFFDIESWTSHIARNYDFAFGSRFHGNVAALQSGIPALWLTHDIRTIELCRHFGLPNIPAENFGAYRSIQDLRDVADFSAFRALFPKRIEEFLDYLEKNGVKQYISEKFLDGLKPWR